MEVLEAEASEDAALQGGRSPASEPYLAMSVMRLARTRALWLLVLIVAAALTATQSPVRMLSTMRRDFLHRLDQAPKLAALHDYASRYPLLPMDEAKLTQVVQGMVQRVGLNLSEGLAERIVRDAASAVPQTGDGNGLAAIQSKRAGILAVHELQGQHAHADQVGAMDALEALGDDCLHTQQ